jgi:hypothetical protein
MPGATADNFEIMTKFPKRDLSELKHRSLEEENLGNSSLVMRWPKK